MNNDIYTSQQKTISLLTNRVTELENIQLTLISALKSAIFAAEHIIMICEKDLEDGESPNPYVKSNPNAVMAECYAATSYVTKCRKALELVK